MPQFRRRMPEVLRHTGFARYLSARLLATLAMQIETVAVGWQMYELTRDPLDLGLIGLAQFIPFVLLILPAGQIADRFDRRRIITLCYATAMVVAVLLLLFTLLEIRSPWPVFAAMTLLGCSRAFSMPSSQALLPNLVPREQFGRAVALNSSVNEISTIGGPALGGVIYLAGPSFAYFTVAVLAAIATVLMLRVPPVPAVEGPKEPVNLSTLFSGLRFVWSKRTVLGAISLDLVAVLLGGATALLPVYASDVLHIGPTGLGVLRTAPGVGAALCAMWLAAHPISNHVGRWLFGGVLVFGIATLVFGVSTSFWISLVALVVIGAGDMVSVYVRHLLVQLETPDAIRGRVSAVSAVFIGASNQLGDFESGLTARWWGATRAVIVGGAATLVVTGLWARLFPGLWKMERFPDRHTAR
jgi:MFS family permease